MRKGFYLMTHSTHFLIYGYMASDMLKDHSEGRKEGSVLFNDALNTFLKMYGYMASGIW